LTKVTFPEASTHLKISECAGSASSAIDASAMNSARFIP